MGCGASRGAHWSDEIVSKWKADAPQHMVRTHWPHNSTVRAPTFSVHIKPGGVKNIGMEVNGKDQAGEVRRALESEASKYDISFRDFNYDAESHKIKSRAGVAYMTATNGNGFVRWATGSTVSAAFPTAISVMHAKRGRVLVFRGEPTAEGAEDDSALLSELHRESLLARVEGSFPVGKLCGDMSGDREFALVCSPTVMGALSEEEHGLLLAIATCGFWRPAAHKAPMDCYGNRGPVLSH